MNLIVDVGNSSVKLAVFQDSKLLKSYIDSIENFFEKFQEIKKDYPQIAFSILSSVIKDTSELEKILEKETKLYVLNENTKLPFKNQLFFTSNFRKRSAGVSCSWFFEVSE